MSSVFKNKDRLWIIFILGLMLYDMISALSIIWGFSTDDAFISWRYARQLADGHGLLWQTSQPPVEGYSNFLWVVIAALVIKLKLPLIATMKVFSTTMLFVGLYSLYRLARVFLEPVLAIMPVFLFSHYIGVVWWTMSGLETTLFWALVVFSYWWLLESPSAMSGIVALLLVSLTRFEGVIWVVPILGYMICERRFDKPWHWIFGFVLPYGMYFFWRLYYFGHWIPNSYSCKALAQYQEFAVDLEYLQVIIPLLVLSLPYFMAPKGCKQTLLWLPSVIYAVMLWKADPVIAHLLRLFLPAFALFSILPVLGVKQFIDEQHWESKWSTAVVMFLTTLIFIPHLTKPYLIELTKHYEQRTNNRMQIAELLNSKAQEEDTVLVGDCGVIPYYAREDLIFIDTQCLNNPELTSPAFYGDRRKYAYYIQQTVKPDWVIASYYPLEHRGDFVTDVLIENHLDKDYELVIVLESGLDGTMVDFIYMVFRKRPLE